MLSVLRLFKFNTCRIGAVHPAVTIRRCSRWYGNVSIFDRDQPDRSTYLSSVSVNSLKTLHLDNSRELFLNRLASLELTARSVLDDIGYRQWQQAAEERISDLHRWEASSIIDLCYALSVRRCERDTLLPLVVGCGVHLYNAKCLTLIEMCRFMTAVGSHHERNNARCERLQPLVDFLEEKITSVPVTELFGAVKKVASINALKLCSIMKAIETVYMDKVHGFWPHELADMAAASMQVSLNHEGYDGTELCLILLEEYGCRVPDFPAEHCVIFLKTMALMVHQVPQLRERVIAAMKASEQLLFSSLDRLSPIEINHLCTSFTLCSYTTQLISFESVLRQRINHFPPNVILNLLSYVAGRNAIQPDILNRFLDILPKQIHLVTVNQLASLLMHVLMQNQVSLTTMKGLLICIEQEVIRRMAENPKQFSASTAVAFFHCFVKASGRFSGTVIGELFKVALTGFKYLSHGDLARFVRASSYLADDGFCAESVLQAIQSRDIRLLDFDIQSMASLSHGFVRLRIFNAEWLQKVAVCCQANLALLLGNHSDKAAHMLVCLSFFGFQQPELFEDVTVWLDMFAVPASVLSQPEITVNILWACALQGYFAIKTLTLLCNEESVLLRLMKITKQSRLLDVNAMWRWRFNSDVISQAQRYILLRSLPGIGTLPASLVQCCDDLSKLLPPDHLKRFVVVEGQKIPCAILKAESGSTVKWPEKIKRSVLPSNVFQLQAMGAQPIALLISPRSSVARNANVELAPQYIKRVTLQSHGWQTLTISVVDYNSYSDKAKRLEFLCAKLAELGIHTQHYAAAVLAPLHTG